MSGRAQVIKSPTDLWKIQAGDVLIARNIDTGFTPYFPVIKGFVAELGGLLSHGAAICREYGLPCIVGATNATVFFRQDERVTLDAESGVIFRSI